MLEFERLQYVCFVLLLLLGYGERKAALVERGDKSTKIRGEIQTLIADDSANDFWIHGRRQHE